MRTNFWSNAAGAHVGIPPTSLYQPIREKVEATMQGHSNPPGQHSREKWAKEVVDDLLGTTLIGRVSHAFGGPPSHIRRGYLAWTMYIVSLLLPYWVLDWLYWRACELGKLRDAVASKDSRKKTQ